MSAEAIGSLFVSLGIDTAAFSRGVKAAQTRVEAFAANLSKRLNGLADIPGIRSLQLGLATVGKGLAAAAGAAAAAAGVAFGGLSISAMNTAKELQNMSRIANATPEEFQKIAHAAASVGISQEKMGDILKDVNDRVGDFIATGGGPMADFFERIAPKVGVTADQFRKLSGPEALQLYVSSLEKANVNQQDFTFFMEAMASDSTALLPLLKNGGAMAKQYGDRLEALGGVMDNKTVASLARMKGSLDEVWIVIKGMGTAIGVAFAPVIEALAQAFVGLGMKGGLLRSIFDAIAAVVGVVAQTIASVVFVVSSLVSGIWNAVSAGAAWINNLTGAGDALRTVLSYSPIGWLNWITALVKQTGGWGEALTLLGEVASGVWGAMVSSAQAIPVGLEAVWATLQAGFYTLLETLQKRWADFLHNIAGAIKNVPFMGDAHEAVANGAIMAASGAFTSRGDADAKRAEATELTERAKGMVTAGLDKASEALGRLKITTGEAETTLQTFSGGGGGLSQVAEKSGGAKAKVSDLEKVMKGLREEAEKLSATMNLSALDAEIWDKQRAAGVQAQSVQGQQIAGLVTQIDRMKQLKDATEEWRSSITGAFASFITQGGSFKKVLSGIIAKLAEMLAQKAFTSLLGGGTAGGGFLSGVMKMFGFANGTLSAPGGLARVNERGGEIMNLPRGTQVIPHDISKRMADSAARGGAGGLDVHVTVSMDETGQLQVANIARREVSSGLQAYDRNMPARLQQISEHPRRY